MPKFTILHIAPITSAHKFSGLFHAVPKLVRSLYAEGIDVALLTTSTRGIFDEPQSFPVMYYRVLGLIPSLRRSLPPFNQPDLVVFHSTYVPLQAFLARECARRGIPYVITPHGGMTRGAQLRKHWKKMVGNFLFFDRMVRNAKAIHCLTEDEAKDVRAWGRPVFVVGNGVDLPPANTLAHPGADNSRRLVFLGRLDIQHKGLDLLVQACAMAQGALRDNRVSVHIYGPDREGSSAKLRAMIEVVGISDIVHLRGPAIGDAKKDAFRSADLFLLTSRQEGHPLAVLEALSYGLPCLLTPGTNMANDLEEAEAGWRVSPDPASIAQGLIEAISSSSALAAKGRAARAMAEQKHLSWPDVARQLLNEYGRFIECN